MKAKIVSELEFDKDVLDIIVLDNENPIDATKDELEQSLFDMAEDWVLRGIKPTIEFELTEAEKKLEVQ